MALIYEDKVPASYRSGFVKKIKEISNKLQINPNWLMAIMYFESARTFSPSKGNNIGCYGLIQFCPDRGKNYKTVNGKQYLMSDIKKMDYSTQLNLVYEYYKPYSGKLKSYSDTYFVTFFPLAIGKPDDWVIEGGGFTAKQIYNSNPAFRYEKDDKIRVWEVKKKILENLPSEWLKEGTVSLAVKSYKNYMIGGVLFIISGLTIYYYYYGRRASK
jgi:hypothetical protein